MKYLLEITEHYRVDSEDEVNAIIEEAKTDSIFALTKYNCVQKDRKAKGEIIDSWYKVSLTKKFNDEKEPGSPVIVTYEEG